MEELPGNSYKAKAQAAETPKPAPTNGKGNADAETVEKIIVGTVVERKKPLGKRFAEVFFGGTAKDAANYTIFEVLIPSLRDIILDALNGGLERLVKGGDSRRVMSRTGGTNRPYFSYNSISRPGYRSDPREVETRRPVEEHDFTDMVFFVRADAEVVLARMGERIDEYGEVTVAFFKKLVGSTPAFTDQRWGWRDLVSARVERIGHEQYVINLPKTEHLPPR